MQTKLFLFFILILNVIHEIESKGCFRRSKWIDNLVKCIRRNSVVHQATILVEERNSEESVMIDEIIHQISSHIPTRLVTYEEIISVQESVDFKDKQSIMNPDGATLPILISTSRNASWLTEVMKTETLNPYYSKPRPKYLMLHLDEVRNSTYDALLKYSWSERFLDVTLIQIVKSSSNTENYLLNEKMGEATVHSYNPFNQSYTKQELTSESFLFPDKTRDLYNTKFKVAFDPGSPEQKVLGETVARSIKSTPVLVSEEGPMDEDVKLSMKPVIYPVEDMVTLHIAVQLRDTVTIHAVIPVLPKQNSGIEISGEFVMKILAIVLGIISITTLVKILKFENRFWRLMYIVQMILGSSVPNEPRRLAERIVFASITLTWVIYSGYLHSILTTIGLHQEPDGINNLEDLIKSDLVTMMDPSLQYMKYFNQDTYWTNLTKNSFVVSDTPYIDSCIKHLLEFKNVTCLIRRGALRYAFRNSSGIRVMKQPVTSSWSVFVIRYPSPYRNRINEVFSRLWESGLMNKVVTIDENENDLEHYDEKESREFVKLLKILVCILVLGFLLSIIAFIAEVIIGWIEKKSESLNIRRNRQA